MGGGGGGAIKLPSKVYIQVAIYSLTNLPSKIIFDLLFQRQKTDGRNRTFTQMAL